MAYNIEREENKAYAEKELDGLYVDLDFASSHDEATVCRKFSVDSRKEIVDVLNEEIQRYERELKEIEEEENEDTYNGVDPGFANELDYLSYKYGYG